MEIYFVFAVSCEVGHKPHRHADIDREVEAHLTRECTKGHESRLSPEPIHNGTSLTAKPVWKDASAYF